MRVQVKKDAPATDTASPAAWLIVEPDNIAAEGIEGHPSQRRYNVLLISDGNSNERLFC